MQKAGPEKANNARPEGTGRRQWFPPLLRNFEPVLLTPFTGHDSWRLCREAHIKQWLELRVRDLATSSRLLRCHSPILVAR